MTYPVDIGLPTNHLKNHSLLFNAATSTIAVQIWVEHEDFVSGEVYVRLQGAKKYHRVATAEPRISDESPISCDGPYLFFVRKKRSADNRSFDFVGIVRVGLQNGEHEVLMTPTMRSGRQWVTSLQCASSDGRIVYGRVGSLPTGSTEVTYSISRIDLDGDSVQELVTLPAVFV